MITALSIPLQHNGGLWTNLSVLIFSFLGLLAITADAFIVEKNKPQEKPATKKTRNKRRKKGRS